MQSVYLLAALAPLAGAILAGFFGRSIGRANSHRVTIAGVAISLLASVYVLLDVLGGNVFNGTVYTWATIGGITDGADAIGKVSAGASLVQIYTGFIYRGPELIGECVNAMRRLGAS